MSANGRQLVGALSANVGRGDWMQTFTGKAFFPFAPNEDDIDILDIAHSLAMQCRYNGHTQVFYSVAEHCWILSHEVSPEYALWALLHDAPEAYISDMIRPIKRHMPAFVALDDHLTAVIARKFGLAGIEIPAEVKEADTRILLDERAQLHRTPPQEWDIALDPLGVDIAAWSPVEAKSRYLHRFHQLPDGRFLA